MTTPPPSAPDRYRDLPGAPAKRYWNRREWDHPRRRGKRVAVWTLGIAYGAILFGMLCACTWPTPRFELYQDYGTEPNGEHPSKFDSGQPATLTYTPNDTALPTISGGKSIITYNSTGIGAGYATAQLGATATYIDAYWNFGSTGTTNSGALALCLFATPMPSGYLSDTPAPDSPAHVVFLNDHFEYGVWQNHDLTTVAKVAYGRTFTTETQHVGVYIRKDLGMAWVLGPTGNVYGPFSHPQIKNVTAPYVTAEQFYGNANTDKRVEIQRWRASSDMHLRG